MATITVTPIKTFVSGETVTPAKLNQLSQSTVALTAATIVAADIASNAVTTAKILNDNVTNAKLASGIDASKLTTGTLPIARIANETIDTAKLADEAVTLAKMELPSNFPVQVVQAVKTDTQTIDTGEDDWVDVSDLSLTLTRRFASNDGAVRVQAAISTTSNNGEHAVAFRIVRGATAIGVGDSAGSRIAATATGNYGGQHTIPSFAIDFIDNSPGAAATVTYKIQARIYSLATGYINRSNTDANVGNYSYRTISTMTLTELTP